jgi:membrane associated rhomboid family serine protease
MFAHGSGLHLLMNSAALLEIGGLLVARLGGFPKGWLRFSIAFAMSGLSSMILFLSVHPSGRVPMIGASGAVYGLMGLLLFIRLSEELDAASIAEVPVAFARFVQNNLFFLFLLVLSGLLAGYSGGIAWEGHLGGFLFGFCVGPWLSPPLGGAKGG